MIDLQIHDDYLQSVSEAILTEAAQAVLDHQSVQKDADLTFVITGDAEIRELNRQFMAVNAPTDVLSFPADELDPETGHHYLGDVIISYPRALAQAEAGGHPAFQELQLLVVHGMLHLLGHDHGTPEEKDKMWTAQAEILRSLDNPLSNPT